MNHSKILRLILKYLDTLIYMILKMIFADVMNLISLVIVFMN